MILAFITRWWHCLTRLHRGATAQDSKMVLWIGCECGATFYGTKPWWWDHA